MNGSAKIKVFSCFTVLLPTAKRLPAKYIFIVGYLVGEERLNNFSFTKQESNG
ncbi:MAG: hypothetical protein JWR61_29 [Ferruginibacter sp.]|jgi:hypothetical protein|nr:hypothetical protein [Ferruginibacter sp.]